MALNVGKLLDVPDAAWWRRWLEAHHATEPEIWLVLHSKASGVPSLPYNESVEEALCFGWIDSIVKKLGADSRAQRFTPRRPGSPISPMNRERVLRLCDAGKMTQAGLDAIGDIDTSWQLPDDIAAALKADHDTWKHYEAFPESYRRIRIGWIDGVRSRPDEFNKRLAYFLKMTRANKRYGMVQ